MSLPGPTATPARRLRDAIEPFHGLCYYIEDTKERYLELGLHPWSSYFGQRAAPMGAVSAEVVTATFYGFSPGLVAKSVPSVWDHLSPVDAWRDRVESVSRALNRLLQPAPDPDEMAHGIDVATQMVAGFANPGHPLGSAHAAMELPEDPVPRLWGLVTALREYRGDGHVAALTVRGVGPVESMLTAGSFSNLSLRFHRRARGWNEDEWDAAAQRARAVGWIDAEGSLTQAGIDLRLELEEHTDAATEHAISAVVPAELEFLIDLTARLSSAVIDAGGFPG